MKKMIFLVILIIGIASILPAADQIYFDTTGGNQFYAAFGGRIGWMHFWSNEKIGLISDLSYHTYTPEACAPDGSYYAATMAHSIGLGTGVVFNNMGMNGVFRTMQYIKLKGIMHVWNEIDNPEPVVFGAWLDLGFALNVFITDKTAISAGFGSEVNILEFPHLYLSLGMKFTL